MLGQPLFDWDTPDGYPDTHRVLGGQHRCRAGTSRNYDRELKSTDDDHRRPRAVSARHGADGAIELHRQECLRRRDLAGDARPRSRTYLGAARSNETRVRETIALAWLVRLPVVLTGSDR